MLRRVLLSIVSIGRVSEMGLMKSWQCLKFQGLNWTGVHEEKHVKKRKADRARTAAATLLARLGGLGGLGEPSSVQGMVVALPMEIQEMVQGHRPAAVEWADNACGQTFPDFQTCRAIASATRTTMAALSRGFTVRANPSYVAIDRIRSCENRHWQPGKTDTPCSR
jgi:hypothetical protein